MNRGGRRDPEEDFTPGMESTGTPSRTMECRVVLLSADGQFACSFVRVVLAIDFGGTLQCFTDAAAYIFRTNVAFELGLLHQLRGLLACLRREARSVPNPESVSARSRMAPRPVASIALMLRRRRMTIGGNLSMDWRMSANFVGRAKKERAVNAVNDRVVGDIFSLQNMHAAVFHVILSDRANGGGFARLCE